MQQVDWKEKWKVRDEILQIKKMDILKKLSHIYNNCKVYVFFTDEYYLSLRVTIRHKYLNTPDICYEETGLEYMDVANANGWCDMEVSKVSKNIDKEVLRYWKG